MSAEYRTPEGHLSQGYPCARCGKTTNMYGTGHGEGKCERNKDLTDAINKANPPEGVKPIYRKTAVISGN